MVVQRQRVLHTDDRYQPGLVLQRLHRAAAIRRRDWLQLQSFTNQSFRWNRPGASRQDSGTQKLSRR